MPLSDVEAYVAISVLVFENTDAGGNDASSNVFVNETTPFLATLADVTLLK